MTGLLCPIGRNLQIAWYSTAHRVVNPGGYVELPAETLRAVVQSRDGEYQTALEQYKSHLAGCEACRKDE